MILEIQDITGADKSFGHVSLPKGVSLGDMFEADEGLKKVAECVMQVSINGARVDDWRSAYAGKNDKIKIILSPKFEAIIGFFAAFSTAFKIISAIVTIFSIGQFVARLFMTPKPPKLNVGGVADSPTYSFEGIRTTLTPGNPVPVIYGMHRVGGQLLSMATDVASVGGRHSNL